MTLSRKVNEARNKLNVDVGNENTIKNLKMGLGRFQEGGDMQVTCSQKH